MVEVVAERSGWAHNRSGKGHAFGFAAHRSFLSYVAAVVEVIDDSGAFQFLGSERYRRDIPLHSGPDRELFSAEEITRFAERAAELNAHHRGDQAMFVMRRPY